MTSTRGVKGGVRALIFTLIAATTMLCSLPQNGWSMLAPVQTKTQGQYDRAADMKTVQTALESKIIRERLKTFGLTDEEIDSRLSQLPDQQVHELADNIDAMNAGGSVAGLLVIGLLVVLIVFVVLRL